MMVKEMDEKVLRAVNEVARNGELSCANAHDTAAELGITPLEMGPIVNRASNLRFYRCQLGLFGYGLKSEGKSKIVLKATNVPQEIEDALTSRTTNGRIACEAVWEVAQQFEYPRLGLGNIVEALGLKVTPCQLGCF